VAVRRAIGPPTSWAAAGSLAANGYYLTEPLRSDEMMEPSGAPLPRLIGASSKVTADEHAQLGKAVRVSPLIVLPAQDLGESVIGHRERGARDARRRGADDVCRDERHFRVLERVAGRSPLRRGTEYSVHPATEAGSVRRATKSVIEPSGTGTRSDAPSKRRSSDGRTMPAKLSRWRWSQYGPM
jgi:hypothetical protein